MIQNVSTIGSARSSPLITRVRIAWKRTRSATASFTWGLGEMGEVGCEFGVEDSMTTRLRAWVDRWKGFRLLRLQKYSVGGAIPTRGDGFFSRGSPAIARSSRC